MVDKDGNPCTCGSEEPAKDAGEQAEEVQAGAAEQPAGEAADEGVEQEIPRPVEEEVKSE